jgi:cyclohexyl-isocyanide hydratase
MGFELLIIPEAPMSEPFQIGFLLFPGLTQLDLTGPAQVLSRMSGSKTHFIAKTLAPVPSDCGLSLVPTVDFAHAPRLDLLCVPGGAGVDSVISDPESLDFVRKKGAEAAWLTSVCTGSPILGAAGLLVGYEAGCHWAWRDLLPLFGAYPSEERVVVDRNRITGGGVTAGIDFAFRVIELLRSREEAEMLRLGLEYDPQPIGMGGTPSTARSEILHRLRGVYEQIGMPQRRDAIIGLAKTLNVTDS